jgi:KDO2-lipid IV(A) lauroyltransferase
MTKPEDQDPPISLRERLVGAALFAPVTLSRLLPYRWRVPVAGWLTARILAPIAGYGKRIRKNLALTHPDLPKAEVRRIVRAVCDNSGRNLVELFSPEFTARAQQASVEGPGLAPAQAALSEGRPIILVSGHFGSFNAARAKVDSMGFVNAAFYRVMANRPFNARYVEEMGKVSGPIFEQSRSGVVQMVRHLRGGGVLAILNDVNAHDGLPLEFFGHPALTSLSAAEMALKYGAPLVPVWAVRAKNGLDFHVIFDEEIPHSDALTMTRTYNARLEAQVRENMGQWHWIHNRWKDGSGNWAAQVRQRELEELENKRISGA